MPQIRMVVTGTQGQLVRSLLEQGPTEGTDVIAVGRPILDLTKPNTIEGPIATARPQVLVSAAAHTDTELAEIEPDVAESINVRGAAAVARCAARLDIPIIHLSTAYVFDGRKATPYRESDPVAPLNAYGRTKWRGEVAVAIAQPRHVILRTSMIYAPFGRNFLTAMLRRAADGAKVAVVDDQLVNPTATHDLAAGILTVARNLVRGAGGPRAFGVFHMAGAKTATPAEFAAAIFAAAEARGGPSARVVPISSAQYQTRVKRPPNSVLDCTKVADIHGVALPPWQPSLQACMDRLTGAVR